MSDMPLILDVLPDQLAVCRLPADAELPGWARNGRGLVSVTRTGDELSVVCPASQVPGGIRQQATFRALKVCGPLDFALTGILARLARPLAEAGIAVFVLSTFDTDYVLVKEATLPKAIDALQSAGVVIHQPARI